MTKPDQHRVLPPHFIDQADEHAWHAPLRQAATDGNVDLVPGDANTITALQRFNDAVNAHAPLAPDALQILLQTMLHNIENAGIGVCLVADAGHQASEIGV